MKERAYVRFEVREVFLADKHVGAIQLSLPEGTLAKWRRIDREHSRIQAWLRAAYLAAEARPQ